MEIKIEVVEITTRVSKPMMIKVKAEDEILTNQR